MTREEHIIYAKNLRTALNMANNFSAETMESLDVAIKALEQLPKLQNRCYVLTQGLMCVFCPYDCEHKMEVEPQEEE